MKRISTLLFVLMVSLMAKSAEAHFIWAIVDPATHQMRLEVAERPGDSVVPLLGKMIASIRRFALGALTDEPDHMHVTAPVGRAGSGGAELLYGVHEGYLVHWYAKGSANVSGAGRGLGMLAEVSLRRSPGGLIASVTNGGKVCPDAQIEVYLPGGKSPLKLRTAADGSIRIPTVKGGLLAIAATVRVAGAGEYKGVHYNETLELCSLTVKL